MVPVRALIYSRVSTDAQERDGSSLDTQERACRAYAQAKGWVVAESSPGGELVAVHRGTATCPCRRRHRRHGTGKDGKNLSRVVRIVALTEIVNWNSGRALLALDRYAF